MVDWGPVAVWAGAFVSSLAVVVALAGGLGWFARRDRPLLSLSFRPGQPWVRRVGDDGTDILWVRVAVENMGKNPAKGCIGRLLGLTTDGQPRSDIDPVQLRWAGVPRSRSFDPIDLRLGQREYLNVVYRSPGRDWQIDTFRDPDFDPGFETHLRAGRVHELKVALFADNAETEAVVLRLELAEEEPRISRPSAPFR